MAIFHMHLKIVGRSKGKSIISASAYINGTSMKDMETGQSFSYRKKDEVVYRSLNLCANAPPEWKTMDLLQAKEHLWNEVLKVEIQSNAQLARSIEFALPKEWSREQQICYASEFIQENFVDVGMCADWVIHDKNTGNPHVHCLLTMRPFTKEHAWGAKEKKGYLLDENGERIPLLDPKTGQQKLGKRNERLWKRGLIDSTGWNNRKNCKRWRQAWEEKCNAHLLPEHHIDHRSHAERGIVDIPTIHEGPEAKRIQERFEMGVGNESSWKVELNRQIKEKNAFLHKLMEAFRGIADKILNWRKIIYDFRRKQYCASGDGRNASGTGRTTGNDNAALSGAYDLQHTTGEIPQAGGIPDRIKQRINAVNRWFAGFREARRGTGDGALGKGAIGTDCEGLDAIGRAIKQREQFIDGTERFLAEASEQLRRRIEVNERFKQLQRRRSHASAVGGASDGNGAKGFADTETDRIQSTIDRVSGEIERRAESGKPESTSEKLARFRAEMERRKQAEGNRPAEHRPPSR